MVRIERLPWKTAGIGVAVALVGLSLQSGTVRQVVTVGGFCIALAGSAWRDIRWSGLSTRNGVVVAGLGMTGMTTYLLASRVLTDARSVVLSTIGVALLLVAGYWRDRVQSSPDYDERQLTIRYRAATFAFRFVTGLLALVVLVGVITARLPATTDAGAIGIVPLLAAGVPLALGWLAFRTAEGYYQRRI